MSIHTILEYREIGPCVICNERTRLTCSVCCKEFYCGIEHQQLHRPLHKHECYPAKILVSPQYGRHLVATRDIRQGEIIFMEKALIHCPNAGGHGASAFLPICLGCCRVVDTESICSRCVWPLCGNKCPMLLYHQLMECDILSRNSVIPSGKGEEYDFIKIIRVLLLEELDYNKWHKLVSLESHIQTRMNFPRDIANVAAAVEFINDACNLKQFDKDQINFAYGICKINSYSSDPQAAPNCSVRLESGIYFHVSLLAHGCIPNIRLIVVEVTKPHSAFAIQTISAVPIKCGQILNYSYVDNTFPTMMRQELLLENFFFTCRCRRCLDPSELGTLYSAIKCPQLDCHGGFFLPMNPHVLYTPWKCTGCHHIRNYSDFANFLHVLRRAISDANYEENPVLSCAKYERILLENQGYTLHPNHHEMYMASCDLLVKILDVILTMSDDLHYLQHIAQKLIFYSKRSLQVADIFNPGLNATRGRILYYMARGMRLYSLITLPALRYNDPIKMMQESEMSDVIKEAKDILFMEPEGSAERLMAEVLGKETY